MRTASSMMESGMEDTTDRSSHAITSYNVQSSASDTRSLLKKKATEMQPCNLMNTEWAHGVTVHTSKETNPGHWCYCDPSRAISIATVTKHVVITIGSVPCVPKDKL
ncbi:hypothetical protein VNO77_04367 [Canavalia gladiata]|uniref:Uncharacterized protein n=1 Tax=Canavalia gladiata TaxID=3824 RepID=A0AAN9N1I4_CANGL